jgi:hypothetical protein
VPGYAVGAASGSAYRHYGHLGLATSAVFIVGATVVMAAVMAVRSLIRRRSVTFASHRRKP